MTFDHKNEHGRIASWNFYSFGVTWHPKCKRIPLDTSITKTFPWHRFKYIWWKEQIWFICDCPASQWSYAINCPISCGPGVTSPRDYGIILTEAKDSNLSFVVAFDYKNNFTVFKIRNRRNRFENECFAMTITLRWVIIPWNGLISQQSERTSL